MSTFEYILLLMPQANLSLEFKICYYPQKLLYNWLVLKKRSL